MVPGLASDGSQDQARKLNHATAPLCLQGHCRTCEGDFTKGSWSHGGSSYGFLYKNLSLVSRSYVEYAHRRHQYGGMVGGRLARGGRDKPYKRWCKKGVDETIWLAARPASVRAKQEKAQKPAKSHTLGVVRGGTPAATGGC